MTVTGRDQNVNVYVLRRFCLHLGKKSRLLFCFRDTFARILRQMICFSIKLEQQSGLIFFFSRMHFVRVLSKKYHVIE